jgi:hypothetical protein
MQEGLSSNTKRLVVTRGVLLCCGCRGSPYPSIVIIYCSPLPMLSGNRKRYTLPATMIPGRLRMVRTLGVEPSYQRSTAAPCTSQVSAELSLRAGFEPASALSPADVSGLEMRFRYDQPSATQPTLRCGLCGYGRTRTRDLPSHAWLSKSPCTGRLLCR